MLEAVSREGPLQLIMPTCVCIYIHIYLSIYLFYLICQKWNLLRELLNFPIGFLSQEEENACDRPCVSPVWGGCLNFTSLMERRELPQLPSCWLFWGIALNFFYWCCSRLWNRGALGTRELILHFRVMEAWGNMRDFVCFAVVLPYQPFQDFLEHLWEIWANLSLWDMLKCFVWYFSSGGSEPFLCSRSFSWQVWCVWCPTEWVAWRHWLLWHGHSHLCLLKPGLGR